MQETHLKPIHECVNVGAYSHLIMRNANNL